MSHTNTENKYAVNTSVTIDAKREDVWAVLAEFDDVYTWAPGVTKSYGIGKQEIGVGHGRHCDIAGFGGLEEYITQWEENRGLTYNVSPVGPLRDGLSRWTVSDAGAGKTRLDIRLSYNLRFGVLGKLMHSLMVRGKLESSLPTTAQAIKSRVEKRSQMSSTSLSMKVA
jgi:hypothetical protein